MRAELKNEKKLEQLARQEKSNNIDDVTGDGMCQRPLDFDKEKKCDAQTIKSELAVSAGVSLSHSEAGRVRRQGCIRIGLSNSMQPTKRGSHNARVLRCVKCRSHECQAHTPAADPKIPKRLGVASNWQSQSLTLTKENPKSRERVGLVQSAGIAPPSLNLQDSPKQVVHETSREDSIVRNKGLSRSDVFQSSTETKRTPLSNRSSQTKNKVSIKSSKFVRYANRTWLSVDKIAEIFTFLCCGLSRRAKDIGDVPSAAYY